MTQTAAPQFDDRAAIRNIIVLVAAQAILGAQMAISFIAAGLAGQVLAADPFYATLPVSIVILVNMFSAPALSWLMAEIGRRNVFWIGALLGLIGGGLNAYAMYIGSFPMLLLGHACLGVYQSTQGFFRFAATDTASPELRPKAISWVLAGGLISAFIGPEIFKAFSDSLAPIPFAGAYVGVMGLNLVGMVILAFLKIPVAQKTDGPKNTGRPLLHILRQPRTLVAIICAMVSYALMNLMMTSTPLAVVGCGFEQADAANVVKFHVIAMFAPSFFTGNLIARFGVERIIAVGLAILLGAGIVALMGVTLEHFYIALILLGIGWNFGFIGGTAMLGSTHAPEERSKVQGINDFLVFGLVAVASFASGGLMNGVGADDVLLGWSAVNIAMVPFLVLAGGALIWLRLSRD